MLNFKIKTMRTINIAERNKIVVEITGICLIILILFTSISLSAQPPLKNNPKGIQEKKFENAKDYLQLTDEQEKKIEQFRLQELKEIQPIKNQMAEKKARLNTLETSTTPDIKQIHKVIEEIGILKTEIQKIKATGKQNFRSVLTEEQRIKADACPGHNKGYGMKNMRHQGKRGFRNFEMQD